MGISHAPGAWLFSLCASTMCPAPAGWEHVETAFSIFFSGKYPIFQPNPSWKLAYKDQTPHSLFLIQNEAVQEEGNH